MPLLVPGIAALLLSALGLTRGAAPVLDAALPALLAAALAALLIAAAAFYVVARRRHVKRSSWPEVVQRGERLELRLITDLESARVRAPGRSLTALLLLGVTAAALLAAAVVMAGMEQRGAFAALGNAMLAAEAAGSGVEWALLAGCAIALFAANAGRLLGLSVAWAQPPVVRSRVVRPLTVPAADALADRLAALRAAAAGLGDPSLADAALHPVALRLAQPRDRDGGGDSTAARLHLIDALTAGLRAAGRAAADARTAVRATAALDLRGAPEPLRHEHAAALAASRKAARRLHRRVTQPQWMKPILRDAGARRIVRMLRRWQAELERTSAPLREVTGWYAALGCDPGASAAEIQQAYRKRMREQHPDLAGDDTDRERREALARRLNEARGRALGYLQKPHAR